MSASQRSFPASGSQTRRARPSEKSARAALQVITTEINKLQKDVDKLDTEISGRLDVSSKIDRVRCLWKDYKQAHNVLLQLVSSSGASSEAAELFDLRSSTRQKCSAMTKNLREIAGLDTNVEFQSRLSLDSPSSTALSHEERHHLSLEILKAQSVKETQDKLDNLETRLLELQLQTEKKKIERESLLREKQLAEMRCILENDEANSGAGRSVISEPGSNRVLSWLSDVSPGVFASHGTAGRDRQLTYGVTDNASVHQETKPGPVDAPRSALDPLARSFHLSGAVSDPTGRHLLISDLKKRPSHPFAGETRLFSKWLTTLQHRMSSLHLDPLDELEILEAHTLEGSPPHRVIQTFGSIIGTDPTAALQTVYEELKQRFGSDVEVASTLYQSLLNFPAITGYENDPGVAGKLRDFSDLCLVVRNSLNDTPELGFLNFSIGLAPIRKKLPLFLDNAWRKFSQTDYSVSCGPLFTQFANFVKNRTDILCKDLLVSRQTGKLVPKYASQPGAAGVQGSKSVRNVNTLITAAVSGVADDVAPSSAASSEVIYKCVLHRSNTHDLASCDLFRTADQRMKRQVVKNNNLCYRCLGCHLAATCEAEVSCGICKSNNHVTLMHLESRKAVSGKRPAKSNVRTGKPSQRAGAANPAISLCTSVCGMERPRSCSKTLLVDVRNPVTGATLRAYAIIDEQSDQSFAAPCLFNFFNIDSPVEPYSLCTLAGYSEEIFGRVIPGLLVKGVRGKEYFPLPDLFENNMIPDTKSEVATPKMLSAHPTLCAFADNFVPLDEQASVILLIGRDGGNLMATCTRQTTAPFVHQTPLGWAVVGTICPLAEASKVRKFNVMRARILTETHDHDHFSARRRFAHAASQNVFVERCDDEMLGFSSNDKQFLSVIRNNMSINSKGNLETPLPLKKESLTLPDNKGAVYRREIGTLQRLRKEPRKLAQCLDAMQAYIEAGHVERVPPSELDAKGKVWFIPVFPVTHPRKNKVRLVFDSAATFQGHSLNSCLLPGPDQNNSLRGVLTRFREGAVGFVADVEAMFHSFYVSPEHRDMMRFFWFDGNNPSKPLVPYRAKVHIFGNCSSPAIATLCLREAARAPGGCVQVDQSKLKDLPSDLAAKARQYIGNNFYVDDGLGAADTTTEAIDVLKAARELLSQFNIRLHKIISNDPKVLVAFPESERAEVVKEVALNDSVSQSALGVTWRVPSDTLHVGASVQDRPFTKRGILSVINSVFDPLGVVAPVVLAGRLIQREIFSPAGSGAPELATYDWDDPLPDRYGEAWQRWLSSLADIGALVIPRAFTPPCFGKVHARTLHVFSDASKDAAGFVIYLKCVNAGGEIRVSFVRGDGKVAPRAAITIPRIELCAAVDASLAAQKVCEELTHKPDSVTFYTDSKVVLGYIGNRTKRFSRYVSRRVDIINSVSDASQWVYVEGRHNPGDVSSRPHTPFTLKSTCWLNGPDFLVKNLPLPEGPAEEVSLPEETSDKKTVLKTVSTRGGSDSIFEALLRHKSSWTAALRVVALVRKVCKSWLQRVRRSRPNEVSPRDEQVGETEGAVNIVIADVQKSVYFDLIKDIQSSSLSAKHKLSSYSPFIDTHGILRVGGRLAKSDLWYGMKHPIILPHAHPISTLVISHYHNLTNHQGRHVTLSAIRNAGFFLERGAKQVRQFIKACLTCKKLRAPLETQQMAELPPDRLEATAPFVNVGLDVMGHWLVHEGSATRKNSRVRKVWAVLFTCLTSRAVHLEMLPSLDTSTFINAFKRFVAVRGPCKIIRSDCGSNFVGALNQSESLNLASVKGKLSLMNCQWIFNPPHASHFGGVWERKIGLVRRALDAALVQLGLRKLTYDELHTFLLEAAAIVNSIPLWSVTDDPNDPLPLSPSLLLTTKAAQPAIAADSEPRDLIAIGPRQWRRVKYLSDQFWIKFRQIYLSELQRRNKWKTPRRHLRCGDLVLIRDKGANRLHWPTGLVQSVKTSADGLVRSATIRTVVTKNPGVISRVYERPIGELVLLEAAPA